MATLELLDEELFDLDLRVGRVDAQNAPRPVVTTCVTNSCTGCCATRNYRPSRTCSRPRLRLDNDGAARTDFV